MENIAGINGCKLGWFCIFEALPSRQLASKIFTTIEDLAKHIERLDVVAIDVPIGLTDFGPRACDVAARKMLGRKRQSSVFPAPVRPALSATTYEEACVRSFAAQQKKLSKQAWAIYPKIRQLDELLTGRRDPSKKIFEVHLEVSFCAWNLMKPIVEPKKSKEGFRARRNLIDQYFGANAFEVTRARYRTKDVANDDILDAFAALWTAERIITDEARTLRGEVATDATGLPMRMVY
jgi:predicted RNase H-like nuclease